MTLAISRLLAEEDLGPAKIDAFLAQHTAPIVEGRTVTFLYRGEADAVFLQHWIFGLPSAQPFTQVLTSDLWYLTQEIPVRSRVEYKLEVQRGDVSRLIRDPLNSQLAHDPFGANSVCQGAEYRIPDWVAPDPEARPGTLERFRLRSSALDGSQEVQIYLPARYRTTRRYPLLIVHDGSDYLHFSVLKTVLDNLIHRLEVAPMIVALTQSRQRLRDYAAHSDHSRRHLKRRERKPAVKKSARSKVTKKTSISARWRKPTSSAAKRSSATARRAVFSPKNDAMRSPAGALMLSLASCRWARGATFRTASCACAPGPRSAWRRPSSPRPSRWCWR